jgi:ribonuclease III
VNDRPHFHFGATPPDIDEAAFAPYASDDRPQRLAAALGIDLANPAYLRLALTHRSVLHEWATIRTTTPLPPSNERLEFLGDAVLGLVVAHDLYERYPDAQEGDLTHWRVALVRAERLVSWAREISLGDYLYLGAGEKITAGARDRMLAGAFEALIAAIALDAGLEAAGGFVLRFARRDLATIVSEAEPANPKGRLQEVLQERFRKGPTYRIVGTDGPDHARIFTAEALIDGERLGAGSGASKRDAEQAAAQDALRAIEADDVVPGDRPAAYDDDRRDGAGAG